LSGRTGSWILAGNLLISIHYHLIATTQPNIKDYYKKFMAEWYLRFQVFLAFLIVVSQLKGYFFKLVDIISSVQGYGIEAPPRGTWTKSR